MMISLWKKCSGVGVQHAQSNEQQGEIRLLNQVLIILNVALLTKATVDAIEGDFLGVIVGTIIFLSFSISFIFQHLQKYTLAKCYFMSMFILAVTLVTTMLGRELGGEFLFFTASILTVVLFFKTRIVYIFFSLIIIGYIFSQWYQINHVGPLAHIVASSSFHFMAIANTFCCILIAMSFIKQNQVFSMESLVLLENLREKNNKLESSQLQIQEQNIRLEEVNLELERFAFIASHDLKTPLRSISSFLQLIDRKLYKIGVKDKQIFEYLGFVIESSKHMYGLIEDVLSYSKIRKGELDFETVDLNKVIESIRTNLHLLIKETDTIINFSNLPTINGNSTSLTLLMQNLIENSIKYNESSRPVIDINCIESEKEIHINVADNGIGIKPVYFEKIFKMFERLHNNENYSGTGIGLAFCRRVAELHGGHVKVVSSSHKGSIFSVTLPKQILAYSSTTLEKR